MMISVLLQSWARVEKPNLKTLVVLAPGCLSCLEYPADDHTQRPSGNEKLSLRCSPPNFATAPDGGSCWLALWGRLR